MYIFALIVLCASVFDAIDGYVARKTKKTSRFGGFLDATLDRISDFFYITAFGYAGLVVWEMVVLALFTTLLVSYTRARGEATLQTGLKLGEGMFQRSGRIIFIGVFLLLFIGFPELRIFEKNVLGTGLLLITVFNSVTIVQRTLSVYKKLS